jgi:glutathione S-transferase
MHSGSAIFGAFVGYLKSAEGSAAEEKKSILDSALIDFNGFIATNGPFLGGASVCTADFALAPKLHHMCVALSHHKAGWALGGGMEAVAAYMDVVTAGASWKATIYPDELIVQGWAEHLKPAGSSS